MLSEQSSKHAIEKKILGKEVPSSDGQPLIPLPFAIQLQNIFPAEIKAKRSAIDTANTPTVHVDMVGITVFPEKLRAQAILDVQVGFPNEPPPFEISFKLVGLFTYPPEYSTDKVHEFLEDGSLSVMLPFAREFLLSLCMRMQVTQVVLSLVQVAPSSSEIAPETTSQ